MKRLFLILFLVCLSSPQEAFSCERDFSLNEDAHEAVTGRPTGQLLAYLQTRHYGNKKKKVRPFDWDGIVAGNVRFLSIGEGNSTLVRQAHDPWFEKHRTHTDHIRAFDVAYTSENKKTWKKLTKQTKLRIRAFPRIYRQGFVQEMDLRDHQGNRLIFDEVFSGFSLTFVIEQYIDKGNYKIPKEILRRIARHMAEDGVLTLAGFTPLKPDPAWDRLIEEVRREKIFNKVIGFYEPDGKDIFTGLGDSLLIFKK